MRALLPELPLIRLLTTFAATFPPRGEGFSVFRIEKQQPAVCSALYPRAQLC